METEYILQNSFSAIKPSSQNYRAMGIVYLLFILQFPLQVYFMMDLDLEINFRLYLQLFNYLSASNWILVLCFLTQAFFHLKGEKQPLTLFYLCSLSLFTNNLLAFFYYVDIIDDFWPYTVMSCLSFFAVLSLNHYCRGLYDTELLVAQVKQIREEQNLIEVDFRGHHRSKVSKGQKHAA